MKVCTVNMYAIGLLVSDCRGSGEGVCVLTSVLLA